MNLSPTELAKRFLEGKRSLVSFRRHFLPGQADCNPSWFHKEWGDLLLNGREHYAIEGYRESGKTSYIRAAVMHRLVYPTPQYDYTVFILANQGLATNKLYEIRDMYLSDPALSANMVKINHKNETTFEITVNDGNDLLDVRIEAYGKGASVRGLQWRDRRPKLVIIDDPQDTDDAQSELTLERDWNWFLSDVKFLSKSGRIFLIGNNLGEKCIVERVFDNKGDLGFQTIRVPVLNEMDESNWPEHDPEEAVLAEKASYAKMGKLDLWIREKMCLASNPETMKFKQEDLRHYVRGDIAGRKMAKFTTVDLAISQKDSADYTAIVTVGVTSDNQWFVLDIDHGRWDPSETINRLFLAVAKHRPLAVGIETVAFQAALAHFIEREMVKRNQFFQIVPLRAEKKKELRILAMQPRFKAGTVWIPETASWRMELEDELLTFDHGAHDDLIDALAYMEQIAYPYSSWSDPEEDESDSWLPIAGGM